MMFLVHVRINDNTSQISSTRGALCVCEGCYTFKTANQNRPKNLSKLYEKLSPSSVFIIKCSFWSITRS